MKIFFYPFDLFFLYNIIPTINAGISINTGSNPPMSGFLNEFWDSDSSKISRVVALTFTIFEAKAD